MEYPAHIRYDKNGNKTVQTVEEHCRAVSEIAGKCLEPAGLSHVGVLAGLLHDMGKYQKAFADYLEKAAKGESVIKGSVIHTFQGCRYILEYDGAGEPADMLLKEVIAYAVGAHHGLFDCCGPASKEHGFEHRMQSEGTDYEAVKKAFLEKEDIRPIYEKAVAECRAFIDKSKEVYKARKGTAGNMKGGSGKCSNQTNMQENHFYFGMLARLVLSSVIEGDRSDSAKFESEMDRPGSSSFTEEDMSSFWKKYAARVNEKLDAMPHTTPVQESRRKISGMCRDFASHRSGVFRLNIPTGSGKTLSSLRFALHHASIHEKRRVIFAAPLLSILEQNSKEIKKYLGDEEIVLEHFGYGKDEGEGREALARKELLAENWDSPVIVTSLVQLLQTLFSGSPACIRRMQALCGSVVVVDEVQTVPIKMLSLFNLAVNFFSEFCGATFVLCSATQPCLEEIEHPLLREPEAIVPFSSELWTPFRRTRILIPEGRRLEEIPSYIIDQMQDVKSLLVICNKKAEAKYLYESLRNAGMESYHLSASMCIKHRRDILDKIKEGLASPKDREAPLVCVSTQVIEAGVDISFEKVVRFAAGMDSIIQAAGRCNRNGEREMSDVIVMDCEGEKLQFLEEIESGKNAFKGLCAAYRYDPERFGSDITSDEAVRHYYHRLYDSFDGKKKDYVIRELSDGVNTVSMLTLLSRNAKYSAASKGHLLNQAFSEAGRRFEVFDNSAFDVTVPYGNGEDLIRELESMHEQKGRLFFKDLKKWMKASKEYMVPVYEYQASRIEEAGGMYEIEGIKILKKEFYHEQLGVVDDASGEMFW